MSSRLSALDGLRGYAALIVVFFHSILEIKPTLVVEVLKKPIYALNSSYDFFTKIALILFNGHAAVALFFVLSGAVLMRSLKRSDEVSISKLLLKFSIQRFFRIYPALIVCLIGIYWFSNYLYAAFPTIFHEHFSIHQFWQNFFLFNVQMHGASWTLQVEMMAIPFVLLVFFLMKRDQFFWIFLILTVLYGVIFAACHPIGFICFILGFTLISPRVSRFFSSFNSILPIFFVVFILSIKHFFPQDETFVIKGIRWFLQGVLIFGLVGFVYHNHHAIFIRWLNHPISQYLGRISYSLYLFNVLFLHALISVTQHYFPNQCTENPLLMGLCIGVMLSLVTMPIAHLAYEYIEKPGIILGKRLIGLGSLFFMKTFKPHMTSD